VPRWSDARGRGLASSLGFVLIGAVIGFGAREAMAAFIETAEAESTFSSDTLEPPTNPATSTAGCLLTRPQIRVSWTATASEWADGYEVGKSLFSGGPYTFVSTVSGQATTSYVDGGLNPLTTYYYVVRATKAGWRSTPTSQVSFTTGIC